MIKKLRNYHDVIEFTEWYLENNADKDGATTREILDYILKKNLFLKGYKLSVSQMGRKLSDSKRFNKRIRYSKKYGNVFNFWTLKK